MLYDRKIKYVDYYESGERVKGGGFVKLEVRDGMLKMDLNIRGLHSTDSFVRDVVLRGSGTEAVLGQITLREGAGSFSCSCEMTGEIGDTGIPYEELQEIKIPVGGTRELCCIWREMSNKSVAPAGSLKAENLETESQETENLETESQETENLETESLETEVQEPEAREFESASENPLITGDRETEARETGMQEAETHEELQKAEIQEAEPEEAEPKEAEPEEAGPEKAGSKEAGPKEAEPKEAGPEKAEPKEAEPRQAQLRQPESRKAEAQEPADNGQSQQEEKPAVKLLEDKWQQLSAIYQHIRPFQDDREYLSLSPSDFVLFPESYYRAANNSFLLHGFYNYKHLILARMERRGEVRYYLGVPGNYYEREKQVAIMFGFESFECAREPAKTGDFGYYMMRMEL